MTNLSQHYFKAAQCARPKVLCDKVSDGVDPDVRIHEQRLGILFIFFFSGSDFHGRQMFRRDHGQSAFPDIDAVAVFHGVMDRIFEKRAEITEIA
jgi:hypothetical protein